MNHHMNNHHHQVAAEEAVEVERCNMPLTSPSSSLVIFVGWRRALRCWRRWMLPAPTIAPPPGTDADSSGVSCNQPAKVDSSKKGVPGSSSICTRSRGSSLPRAVWRSRDFGGPPAAASARLAASTGHEPPTTDRSEHAPPREQTNEQTNEQAPDLHE